MCFTGDAADWGRREEFAEADEFLVALLKGLGLGRDRLFVVLGNHDVDRSVHRGWWKKLRTTVGEVDELGFARWIAGGDPPRGTEASWRDQVLKRLAAYRLPAMLPDTVCVFFDLQGHPVDSPANFFQALARETLEQARHNRGLTLPSLPEGPPFESASAWLESLERTAASGAFSCVSTSSRPWSEASPARVASSCN